MNSILCLIKNDWTIKENYVICSSLKLYLVIFIIDESTPGSSEEIKEYRIIKFCKEVWHDSVGKIPQIGYLPDV